MTFKSLLVVLDPDHHCGARTRAAIGLARRFEAHLTGLAPTGLVDLPAVPYAAASISEYAAVAWDALRAQAEQISGRFRDQCHAAGLRAFDVAIEEADQARSVVQRAHCADLVVLTQADPASDGHRATQLLVESVALHSARPTLILPYAGSFDRIGHKVLVAWDDSREAARAVADALPFLRQAAEVRVVGWGETGATDLARTGTALDAVCGWLKHHGVHATPQVEPATSQVGDAMLSRAADWDSGLIVMGAYGHARWAERVLGGATRQMLQSMTVPVLMSH